MGASSCPRCLTTKYHNPQLRFMVNVCGHTLCESCVELLFVKGAGNCPQCQTPLRRIGFRMQCFEDSAVEKEIHIRKRVLRDYNKTEEDFESLDSYNNYLEEIETIVYNLCNDINVIETNKRIDQYKRENRDIIHRNRFRVSRSLQELEQVDKIERLQKEDRRRELMDLKNKNRLMKEQHRQSLINELINSTEDTDAIVKKFAEREMELIEQEKQLPPLKPLTQFSTGIKIGQPDYQTFLPVPKEEDGPLYKHETPTMFVEGPNPPNLHDIYRRGFMKHIRCESIIEKAGGYTATYACERALQEAVQGLFFCLKRSVK